LNATARHNNVIACPIADFHAVGTHFYGLVAIFYDHFSIGHGEIRVHIEVEVH